MGAPIIGRTGCPECTFDGAHVKRSEKCLYRYCPECGAMYHAKTARQVADLMAKTRLVEPLGLGPVGLDPVGAPTPTPTPEQLAPTPEISPDLTVLATANAPAPAPTPPVPRKPPAAPARRSGLFGF